MHYIWAGRKARSHFSSYKVILYLYIALKVYTQILRLLVQQCMQKTE